MREYHIHVDAKWLSSELEHFLTDVLGFWRMDFIREHHGHSNHAPERHLTLKLFDGREFKSAFRRIEEFVSSKKALVGYIEGEYVAIDRAIPVRPFDPTVPIPFTVDLEQLQPGRFRQSEVHVTLSRDHSDFRLLTNLSAMGLYSALIPKTYGIGLVFTVQGSQQTISKLVPPLIEYLHAAGGCMSGSVKEERIASYWVSDPNLVLPPVVSATKWTSLDGVQ